MYHHYLLTTNNFSRIRYYILWWFNLSWWETGGHINVCEAVWELNPTSWADGAWESSAFLVRQLKTHACFLYGGIKCLIHPIFSQIILLKEHNNICPPIFVYELVLFKRHKICCETPFERSCCKSKVTQDPITFSEEKINALTTAFTAHVMRNTCLKLFKCIRWKYVKFLKSYTVYSVSVWQDRSDQEQPSPSLCQGFLTGLLLWGGAEAAIWSLWHSWHSQHRDPRWWLSGWGGVHSWTGRQMPLPYQPIFLLCMIIISFFLFKNRQMYGD